VTFPIKKRINTEPFIDEKLILYTQEVDQKLLVGPLRERYKQLARMPEHMGMKTNYCSLLEIKE